MEENLFTEQLKISSKLENIIDECILYHHTDMFFNFIFRYIIDKEFSPNQEIKEFRELEKISKKFKKLCYYILLESVKVMIWDYEKITESEEIYLNENYFKLINHAKDYCSVINIYASSLDENSLEVIRLELDEEPPIFNKFQQICLVKGYELAQNRIEKNLKNLEFFNHELLKTKNLEVIKLFPTPYGFGKKWELIENVKNSNFLNLMEKYMFKHEFHLVRDKHIIQQLGTKFIFQSKNENNLYYYKKRTINGDYVEFGEQDRKDPYRSIIVQGQLNLTRK